MPIIFTFPNNEKPSIAKKLNLSPGSFTIKKFPDKETLITIETDVKDKEIIILCGLDDPDSKIMPLMFFTQTAKELGAKHITLIAPYLGYLRQDKRFNEGEAVTSKIFAKLLSSLVDKIITFDPHLHRYKTLDEVYTIPTTVLHSTDAIAEWIKKNVENPLIVGPDEESTQWAEAIKMPFIISTKKRSGDKEVEITLPDVSAYKDHTPVLVDDIISTARTMIETVKKLLEANMKPPICIGIHGIFAQDAYEKLQESGAAQIVTTNSISHETNQIDLTTELKKYLV